jgi:hypothetical protein
VRLIHGRNDRRKQDRRLRGAVSLGRVRWGNHWCGVVLYLPRTMYWFAIVPKFRSML